MAASDATPFPIKNQSFRLTFEVYKVDGTLNTGGTGMDTELSRDAAVFSDATNEAVEIASSSGIYYIDLTAAEMNYKTVVVKCTFTNAGTIPVIAVLYPQAVGDIKVELSPTGIQSIWQYVIEGTKTIEQLMRIMLAALAGKASGANSTNPRFRDLADIKDRINATTDADGNRTSVILDGT